MAKDTNENYETGTIDLEDMEMQFGDDDSLASAINAALEDAGAAVSRKPEAEAVPDLEEEDEIEIETEAEIIEEPAAEAEEKPQGLVEVEDEEEVQEEKTKPAAPEKKAAKSSAKPPVKPPAKPPVPPAASSDEHYDRLLRVMAEFDNYKKRVVKEKEEFQKFALEKLLTQFLPVMDNFERAIAHCDNNEHTKSLLDGIMMIFKQLNDVLAKSGVRSFKSIGKSFDPTKHQAVQMKETREAEPNVIIEEYQKGYFLHDRLIRAAMVVVAQEPSDLDDVDFPSIGEDVVEEIPQANENEEEEIEELDELVEEPEVEELEPID